MTIYDIAEKAGVSASTVSRVINGKPGVGEKTRKRIKELLEENHYTPDVAARGLVMQSSGIIGILIEDIRVSHHTDAVYIIQKEMTEHGYSCMILSTGSETEKKCEYIRALEQRRVEGVIMIGSMFGEDERLIEGHADAYICGQRMLSAAEERGQRLKEEIRLHIGETPVVMVNGRMDLPNVYCVIADEERGTLECVSYLVGKGKKRIVYVMDVYSPSNCRKLNGYCAGMRLHGLTERICIAPGEGTDPLDAIGRGRAAVSEILKVFPEVDAIMCTTDELGVGCIQGLQREGIKIPGDVAVMGVNNALYGQIMQPLMSTLDNKLEESSRYAVGILLEAMQKKEVPHHMLLPADIVERQSS